MRHFISVYTVCISTHLGDISIQQVNGESDTICTVCRGITFAPHKNKYKVYTNKLVIIALICPCFIIKNFNRDIVISRKHYLAIHFNEVKQPHKI